MTPLSQRERQLWLDNAHGYEANVWSYQHAVLAGLLRFPQHVSKCRKHWFATDAEHARLFEAIKACGEVKRLGEHLTGKDLERARFKYTLDVGEEDLMGYIRNLESCVRAYAYNVSRGWV